MTFKCVKKLLVILKWLSVTVEDWKSVLGMLLCQLKFIK